MGGGEEPILRVEEEGLGEEEEEDAFEVGG